MAHMAHEDADGPAALLLMATVARRYYLDGATKSEIGAELGLSRFKVARLIEHARASGLVRIELDHRGGFELDLSLRLQAAHGLRHCVVVDGPDDHELLRADIGRAAARGDRGRALRLRHRDRLGSPPADQRRVQDRQHVAAAHRREHPARRDPRCVRLQPGLGSAWPARHGPRRAPAPEHDHDPRSRGGPHRPRRDLRVRVRRPQHDLAHC